MATRNEIDSNIPIEVEKGGTETAAFVAYTPICGGTGAATALQSVASIANANDILTSEGAGAIPVFKTPITYFEQLASDPGSPTIGQVWYNTTTDLFKGAIGVVSGAWVIKAVATYASYYGGSGVPDDALGNNGGAQTQRYDGVADSWATKTGYGGTILPPVIAGDDAGDALGCGGINGSVVSGLLKRYDGVGDSWTTKTSASVACSGPGLRGEADDALKFGGRIDPLTGWTGTSAAERYDGVGNSWTTKTSFSGTVASLILSAGTAGDCLRCGGVTSSGGTQTADVERYDGVGNSWTTKTSMNTSRGDGGYGSAAASAIVWAGSAGGVTYTKQCERYDGVGDSWSAGPTLNDNHSPTASVADSNTSALGWSSGAAPTKSTERLGSTSISVVTFTTT